jgi:GT2 family glycosyltransferase
MMNVLAAVVSYCNPDITLSCVESLLRSKDVCLDVVLWDNASPDGTAEYVRSHIEDRADLFPDTNSFTLVQSEDNLLWAPAINSVFALREPRHELLLACNNDICFDEFGVYRLGRHLERDSSVGLVGPFANSIGGPQEFVEPWPGNVVTLAERNCYLMDRRLRRVAFLIGACTMTRVGVWDEVGELDESMPLGADDHDYCIRLKDADYKIGLAEDVYVDHVGHASARGTGGEENWRVWGDRSWDAFNKKWEGYFASEEEAINAHWGGKFVLGFEKGTGWL